MTTPAATAWHWPRLAGPLIGLLLMVLAAPLYAQTPTQLQSPLPASHVLDRASLLRADSRSELDRLATTLNRSGQGQLAVVLIGSTGKLAARRYATEVFNRWGVGNAGRNDGLMLLLALDDRAAEIVLGSGIDNAANRRHTDAVMRDVLLPRLRQGQLDLAVLDSASALLIRVYGLDLTRPAEAPDPASVAAATDGPPTGAVELVASSAPVMATAPLVPRPTAASQRSDQSGGARSRPETWIWVVLSAIAAAVLSLLWMLSKLLRHIWSFTIAPWIPRRCGSCSLQMQKLGEIEEKAYLAPAQLTEERLRSVDHRVFLCRRCGRVDKLEHRAWFSRYSRCAHCATKALSRTSRTLEAATRWSEGRIEIRECCQHCGHESRSEKVLPRLPAEDNQASNWSSGSDSGWGGGSSSGGGSSGRW